MGLLPLIVIIAALALVGFAVVQYRSTEIFRRLSVPAQLGPSLRTARRGFRRRAVVALAAATVVGVAAVAINDALPGSYDLVFLLAPALMSLAGLAVIAAVPRVHVSETGSQRSADLAPRHPWSFAPAWARLLPATAGGLLLATIVGFGLTATTEDGLSRALRIDSRAYSSTATPYPGWFYGLPVLLAAAVLAVVAAAALARVAASARPTDPTLRDADQVMRMLITRVIVKLTTGTFTVYLGGLMFLGGRAMLSASGQWHDGSYARIEPWATIAVALFSVGLIIVGIGAVLVVLAVLDAVTPPFTVASAPRQAPTTEPTAPTTEPTEPTTPTRA